MELSFQIILGALLAVSLLLLLWLVHRQRKALAEMRAQYEQSQRQQQILQESLQGIGQRLLEQDKRLLQLARAPAAPVSQGDSESLNIVRKLDEGKSAAQIASETGLEEVEISLLAQIHSANKPAEKA